MKRSNLATLIVFLVLIPLTLVLGSKIPGRLYYITGTLIIMDLQKKDRTFLGTLPENWYPWPSEKCLEPSGKLCRLL